MEAEERVHQLKVEDGELEGKREDRGLWKLLQLSGILGDSGITLENTVPHLIRTESVCKIYSIFQGI